MGLSEPWTGRTACALQAALRLSNELFAERLGIHPRTVAAWHQKPDLKPNSEMQNRLDKALDRATPQVESRFSELLDDFPTEKSTDTSAAVRTSADLVLSDLLATRVDTPDPAEQTWKQLVLSSGEVIELAMNVTLDIEEDGWARVTYRHELANMGTRPMSRLSRQLWFEHTRGPLKITPIEDGAHRITIHRTHDTPSSAQFACLISPPIKPRERAVVGYTCEGGRFVTDHYWRQSVARHTRQLTINLHHRGAAGLMDYTATEEHPDGAENSAIEALEWDERDGAVDLALTRQYLRPGQAVTLRWAVSRASP
jgi:transcriptional regulator with XRE-family HTH domain